MTDIVKVRSILDINFEQLADQGISHVMSDVESTLCPYGTTEIDPLILRHINNARDLGFIATFDLVTNKTNPAFLNAIGAQFQGAGVYSPTDRSERKPSSAMLDASIQSQAKRTTLEPRLDVAIMIGDKYTGDMKAAKRAGVAYGFWVKRLGSTDHIGDRLFRRPYESILYPFIR